MRFRKRSADSLTLGPGWVSTCVKVCAPEAGSTLNDPVCASWSRLYAAMSTSCETLIAPAGHAVTHARHWMQAAYDTESVLRAGDGVAA